MGLQETFLLQSILKRKASFFGHIARGSAGEELKVIVAEGWRKVGRGRRRRRWMDDVELVTGTKDVRKNIEMVEDKEVTLGPKSQNLSYVVDYSASPHSSSFINNFVVYDHGICALLDFFAHIPFLFLDFQTNRIVC
ncbi:hypothetical protein GQR58_023107 [Nymphon striatum]|nr:hypothetical protein GQR58_023107 [Nymphon striatum]